MLRWTLRWTPSVVPLRKCVPVLTQGTLRQCAAVRITSGAIREPPQNELLPALSRMPALNAYFPLGDTSLPPTILVPNVLFIKSDCWINALYSAGPSTMVASTIAHVARTAAVAIAENFILMGDCDAFDGDEMFSDEVLQGKCRCD